MKIISKYKDFYDYLAQDYNADITYVRKPFWITDKLDIIFKEVFKGGHYNLFGYRYNQDISIHTMFFGIYPYVYGVPFAKIKYKTNVNNTEYYFYFFSINDLDNIITKNNMIDFCNDKITKYIESLEYPANTAKPLYKYEYNTYYKNVGAEIKKRIIKKEAKEVFEYIGAPVFCEVSPIIDDNAYYDLKDYKGREKLELYNKYWIGNCSFNKLGKDILKIWIGELMSVNTYNNIENFLWSIKTEPISVPDNKTKILNHGFDLKTSFRNM